MSKLERARDTILGYAFAASGVIGAFKIFVPIPYIEVGALTWCTKSMCDRIARIYGYESLSGMSTFFGVVIGAALGVKLATGILDTIPGIGATANAIATFTLHSVTGVILIAVCELLDDGCITESDIRNSSAATISKILGTVTDNVAGFVRGNPVDAINHVKEAYRESVS